MHALASHALAQPCLPSTGKPFLSHTSTPFAPSSIILRTDSMVKINKRTLSRSWAHTPAAHGETSVKMALRKLKATQSSIHTWARWIQSTGTQHGKLGRQLILAISLFGVYAKSHQMRAPAASCAFRTTTAAQKPWRR